MKAGKNSNDLSDDTSKREKFVFQNITSIEMKEILENGYSEPETFWRIVLAIEF